MRYMFGDFMLDTERYELHRSGTLVNMQPKVFDVLTYLLEHRERVVSKEELLEQFWPGQFISEATLNSCIRAVRQAVWDSGQVQRVIQTRHGRGFRFVAALVGGDEGQHERARSPSLATPRALEAAANPEAGGPEIMREAPEPATLERPTASVVEAEHKLVTVLRAGLVDAPVQAVRLGPEAMHRLMQMCFATAQRVLSPYGGTLTHVTGEGFLALFGAPQAQEDHARRAVLAAVALQQAWQANSASVSPPMLLGIGVHTGPVVVGGLGAESHRLYTAVGETVDLAYRLRKRAAPAHPGGGESALDRPHLGGVAHRSRRARRRGGDPAAGDLPARLSPRLAGAVLCDAISLAAADR
jgi:DNA-binding winged helix-turn-helix (wHTH) protein